MKILHYHYSVFLDLHMGVLLDEAICMQEQGHDIDAACGQLRSKKMNKDA